MEQSRKNRTDNKLNIINMNDIKKARVIRKKRDKLDYNGVIVARW